MKRTTTLFALLVVLTTSILFAQKPNVIVIIADDMGWSQVSTGLTNFNNQSDFYETPVLATLASEGIAFPNGYVNGANCAPTRAAMLSGQYAARPHNNVFNVYDLNRGNGGSLLVGPDMGIASNGNIDEIPESAVTIAETLKTVGYSTAHLGKFHVGENSWQSAVSNNNAYQQGFDYNYGGGTKGTPGAYHASGSGVNWTFHANIGPELDEDPISNVKYALPYTSDESTALAVGGYNLENEEKHVTDAMTDAAIYFMESEKNNPFFMHFSNFAVHSPTGQVHARPDLYAKYQTKNSTNPSSMGHTNLGLAAILEGMDQSIGRLIDYLNSTPDPRNSNLPLSYNTLVYFVSDNGGAQNTEENGPLRGMKGEYYEGGIRSVSIAWSHPTNGLLANPGTVNSTPVIGFDLYPTLADMAGASLPGGAYDIDGTSLWPLLNVGTVPARDALFWHFPGYLIDSKRDQRPVTAMRKGGYKLIHNYETIDYELYDLNIDISETTNLLPTSDQSIVDLANDMITDMRNHLITTSAPLPTYRSGLDAGNEVPLPDFIALTSSGNSGDGCQVATGYNAFWDFDTFNNADDASANSHDPVSVSGTLVYDVIDFIEGDQSVNFNGSTNIQYSSGSFMTAATSTRSVIVWIKASGDLTTAGIQNILDEGGNLAGIGLRLNGTNLESIIKESAGSLNQLSAVYPNDSDWHHVALVYDGGNTNQKLYIDGLEVANGSAPSNVPSHTGLGGIAGKISGTDSFGNSTDANFTGKMDAFAFYNTVLNATQIEDSSCRNTLSITEQQIGIGIYPNPFEDKISINLNEFSKNISIELFDILGKSLMYKEYSNSKMINLPLLELTQGVYLLKVKSSYGLTIKKIIKN